MNEFAHILMLSHVVPLILHCTLVFHGTLILHGILVFHGAGIFHSALLFHGVALLLHHMLALPCLLFFFLELRREALVLNSKPGSPLTTIDYL